MGRICRARRRWSAGHRRCLKAQAAQVLLDPRDTGFLPLETDQNALRYSPDVLGQCCHSPQPPLQPSSAPGCFRAQVKAIFTGNSTGNVGGWFFPQGFTNSGSITSPPSVVNVRPCLANLLRLPRALHLCSRVNCCETSSGAPGSDERSLQRCCCCRNHKHARPLGVRNMPSHI